MRISIMSDKKSVKALQYAAAVIFWLALWHFVSLKINKSIILVSPAEVIKTLFSLVRETAFWSAVMFSFIRIAGGFLLALVLGTALAVTASSVPFIKALLSPLISAMKSTPVASFVILVLLWLPSRNLAVVISFLMVFPIIYTNVLNGILNVDKKLIEMADVFKIGKVKKMLYIYLPDVMPFFISACTVSLGMSWKSGIAAEVIGQPDGSIGERLYKSKLLLETPDLFAWTVVIIVISYVFERLFLLLLKLISDRIERGGIAWK
jgi:NitT/TauT family transport system permease protein